MKTAIFARCARNAARSAKPNGFLKTDQLTRRTRTSFQRLACLYLRVLSSALPAIAVSGCGSAEAAKPASAEVETRGVARPAIDVAGVTIGMAGADVVSVLRAAGYVDQAVMRSGSSWEHQVTRGVSALTKTEIFDPNGSQGELERIDAKKGLERVIVVLAATPDGRRVEGVTYMGIRPAATAAQNRSDLDRKYGRPSVSYSSGSVLWCSAGETDCRVMKQRSPSIFYTPQDGSLVIELKAGSRMRQELDAKMKTAIAARVAKAGRSF